VQHRGTVKSGMGMTTEKNQELQTAEVRAEFFDK